jgi:hypothetical protein
MPIKVRKWSEDFPDIIHNANGQFGFIFRLLIFHTEFQDLFEIILAKLLSRWKNPLLLLNFSQMRYRNFIFKILATVIHIWRSLVLAELTLPSTLTSCTPDVTTEAAMCCYVTQATAECLISTVLSSCCPAQILHRQWKALHGCMTSLQHS